MTTAERRSADERRGNRGMAKGFGNIQKIVEEEMDEDGSDMCHILKLVADLQDFFYTKKKSFS